MCLRMNRKKMIRNSLFFDNYKKLFSFRKFVFFKQAKEIFSRKYQKNFSLNVKNRFFRKV